MQTSAPQRGRYAHAQIRLAVLALLASIGSAHAQDQSSTQTPIQTPEANAAAAGPPQPAHLPRARPAP
ncbi:MAG TPA: hypothetical protein DEP03_10325, partial [Massilia sp.]|nr:hypothetical protein [Massilia sp.]